jgi:hypothetical protein
MIIKLMTSYPSFILIFALLLLPNAANGQFSKIPERKSAFFIAEQILDSIPYTTRGEELLFLQDFRHCDLSRIDLRSYFKLLLSSSFDSRTIWPKDRLPEYFRPELIEVFSKDPGIGIRQAALKGHTAKARGIAIVGPPILPQHDEYNNRLRHYQEFGTVSDTASIDGTSWASITVGQRTGIAFEAWLYYFAVPHEVRDGEHYYDAESLFQALRHIARLISQLPADETLHSLALPYLIDDESPRHEEIQKLLQLLSDDGLAVFSRSSSPFGEGTFVYGLGRDPLRNPEDYMFWRPANYWHEGFETVLANDEDKLFVPLDTRSLASPTHRDHYALYRYLPEYFLLPYLAACYTLAASSDANLDPQGFWKLAKKHGTHVNLKSGNKSYNLDRVLNMFLLLDALPKSKQ